MHIRSAMRGFTFIEILITIGILAVLAVVGTLNLFGYSQGRILQDEAAKIAFVLRNAHDKSVAQADGEQWGVHFSNPVSGSDFYEIFKGDNYATGAVVTHVSLSKNIVFTAPPSGSSTDVIFSQVSGLSQEINSIIISLGSNAASSSTIIVNTNGQIQY